jgi:hypothetical protein
MAPSVSREDWPARAALEIYARDGRKKRDRRVSALSSRDWGCEGTITCDVCGELRGLAYEMATVAKCNMVRTLNTFVVSWSSLEASS